MKQSSNQPCLTPEQQRKVQRILTTGEAVLWAGQSSLLRHVRREGMEIIGSAFFGLIGIMITVGGWVHGQWLAWVGVAILLASVWGITRGWKRASAAAQSVYLVTNQRVAILSSDGDLKALTGKETSGRTVKTGSSGVGDLYFTAWEKKIESSDGGSLQRNGFLGIPNPAAVDELIGSTFGEDPPAR